MSKEAYELVIQPPPFKMKGGRASADGRKWSASVEFDTPRGPATIEVLLTLPEAVKSLVLEIFHRLINAAAKKKLVWHIENEPQVAAGFFGVSIPNPAKLIKRGAAKMSRAAKGVVNKAFKLLPGPVQQVAGPLLKQIAAASNPMALANVVRKVAKLTGSLKIPGTDIPLIALSPVGAAVVFGSKLIGKKATEELLDAAVDTAEAAVAAGAMRKIAPKVAANKATAVAKSLATNAQFAREVGLPTLNVAPDLHDAGRLMVSVLRGVYLGNPEATKRLKGIAVLAKKGDAKARILWNLARQISDAARSVRSGSAVGDGYGPGYGLTGYRPPPLAAQG